MNSWIKIDKALFTKPEFRRLVRRFEEFFGVDLQGNGLDYAHAEAITLGYLTKLWAHADTHIREDNTLDMSADEIDELLGVDGIAEVFGPHWLEILDSEDQVRLPNWLAHNNTYARTKAQDLARQHKHRASRKRVTGSNGTTLQGVTDPVTQGRDRASRAETKPVTTDLIRPDLTKPLKKAEPPTAARRGSAGIRHVGDLLQLKTTTEKDS